MPVTVDSNPDVRNNAFALDLFRHSRRPQWGLAVVVWERGDKRGFRFEDGSERAFKEGYYDLFEPVPAVGEAANVLARLALQVAEAETEASGVPSGPSLTELVAVFRELYPDGFVDAQWISRRRGDGSRRRAKRHRSAAVEHAASMLSREVLDSALAASDAAGVVQRFVAVMVATDLVTSKQLDSLRKASPTLALAQALRDLVHEPDPEGTRFDAVLKLLVRSPGGRPSWQLLSGMRALVDPQQDVCIRPSVFFAAAQTVNRGRARKVSPTGPSYERLVAVARDLRDRIVALGEAPRDMLDVYDFMWDTCRPAAASVLTELRARRAAMATAPVEVVTANVPASEEAVVANVPATDEAVVADTPALDEVMVADTSASGDAVAEPVTEDLAGLLQAAAHLERVSITGPTADAA